MICLISHLGIFRVYVKLAQGKFPLGKKHFIPIIAALVLCRVVPCNSDGSKKGIDLYLVVHPT